MTALQISLKFLTKYTFQFSMTAPAVGIFAVVPIQVLEGVEHAKQSEVPAFVMIGWKPVVAKRLVRRGGERHVDLFTAEDVRAMTRSQRKGLTRVRHALLRRNAK